MLLPFFNLRRQAIQLIGIIFHKIIEMRSLALGLCLIILTLISCVQEQKGKIPGSYSALELWTYQRAYPDSDIPSGAFYQGFLDHKDQFLNNSRSKTDNWEAMGPLNTAGRMLSLTVNPQAPNTIYAGTASGGLWRSRNLGLGQSWEYVETGFPVLGVSTIEFEPQDSMVMYIGTGEVYNFFDTGTDGAERATRGSYGIGILKSIDGGATWNPSLDWTYQENRGVWMVRVAPTAINVVYAATTEGIFKSEDSGETWTNVNSTIMATDIDINPLDENDVVACFGNFSTPGKGIFRTRDGGETWTPYTIDNSPLIDFNGKIQIARAPSNPNRLYASFGNGFGFDDGATALLSSEDGGSLWSLVNNTDYSQWQGWFSHDVAVNPLDEESVVAVGIAVHVSDNEGRDLFNPNFGNVTSGTPPIDGPDGPENYVHSDIHFVTYHPTIADLVLLGTDGGLFLSYDGGLTFRSANGGLQTTQFYNGFSVSATDSLFVMGGLQDNSTVINRGDGVWQRAVGGDGSWTAINQSNDNVIYGSSQRLRILRSTSRGNGGFSTISPSLLPDDEAIFIAPYVVSVDNPDILYAGTRYVYKSVFGGGGWLLTNGGKMIDGGNRIFAMDDYDLDSDVVYVATVPDNGTPNVLSTQDGGDSWQGSGSGLPNRVPNDVIAFNVDPSMALSCFSGFGTNHLFYTNDFGNSWVALDETLPDVPGNSIAIDEINQVIYYGTDISVYYSTYELGSNNELLLEEWQILGEGLPLAVIALDLEISKSDQKLWVATHGNGTYRIDLINNLQVAVDETPDFELNIFPNPTTDWINITSEEELLRYELYSQSGQLLDTGQETKINVSALSNGSYLLRLRSEKGSVTTSFVRI